MKSDVFFHIVVGYFPGQRHEFESIVSWCFRILQYRLLIRLPNIREPVIFDMQSNNRAPTASNQSIHTTIVGYIITNSKYLSRLYTDSIAILLQHFTAGLGLVVVRWYHRKCWHSRQIRGNCVLHDLKLLRVLNLIIVLVHSIFNSRKQAGPLWATVCLSN